MSETPPQHGARSRRIPRPHAAWALPPHTHTHTHGRGHPHTYDYRNADPTRQRSARSIMAEIEAAAPMVPTVAALAAGSRLLDTPIGFADLPDEVD